MGSVITLLSATAGAGAWANVDSMDIPQNGALEGVCVSVSDDSDTDADQIAVNLTFSSTAGDATSDSRASILSFGKTFQVVTSGATDGHPLVYCKLPDIPVAAGERIYLHQFATSGVTPTIRIGLHFSFNQPVPSSRR